MPIYKRKSVLASAALLGLAGIAAGITSSMASTEASAFKKVCYDSILESSSAVTALPTQRASGMLLDEGPMFKGSKSSFRLISAEAISSLRALKVHYSKLSGLGKSYAPNIALPVDSAISSLETALASIEAITISQAHRKWQEDFGAITDLAQNYAYYYLLGDGFEGEAAFAKVALDVWQEKVDKEFDLLLPQAKSDEIVSNVNAAREQVRTVTDLCRVVASK